MIRKRPVKAPVPLERDIHKGIVSLLRDHALPGVVWFHVANERKCTPKQGAMLRAMGVLPGVSDFIIIRRSVVGAVSFFLEVKRPGEQLTKAQEDFQHNIRGLGCTFAVARSTDEAALYFRAWGIMRRAREAT